MSNEQIPRRIKVGVLSAGVLLSLAAPELGSSTRFAQRCRTGQLQLVAGFYGEAGGAFTQTFTFSNASREACQLKGWPRLRLESKSGRLVSVAYRRVVQAAPPAPAFATFLLKPGGAASFDVYGADWNHAANRVCPETTAAVITPPGDRLARLVSVRMPNCGLFYIAPLITGRTDRQSWSVVWHR